MLLNARICSSLSLAVTYDLQPNIGLQHLFLLDDTYQL